MTDNMTERKMQVVLMQWLLTTKNHIIAIPNSTVFFSWEADLIGITKAHISHEIEIKISHSDFLKDKKKTWKHQKLAFPTLFNDGYRASIPNYFWYATPEGIDIEPPEYAGWLIVKKTHSWYQTIVKKPANKLHSNKVPEKKFITVARIMSFRLLNEWKIKK